MTFESIQILKQFQNNIKKESYELKQNKHELITKLNDQFNEKVIDDFVNSIVIYDNNEAFDYKDKIPSYWFYIDVKNKQTGNIFNKRYLVVKNKKGRIITIEDLIDESNRKMFYILFNDYDDYQIGYKDELYEEFQDIVY